MTRQQRLASLVCVAVFAGVAIAGTGPASAARPFTANAVRGHATSVTISAVGDTLLGNTPDVPSNPYRYLAPVRRAVRRNQDVVFGNLEGTFTTATSSKCGGPNGGDCFAFRTPPAFARAYARTGFTVLNDANNHSHDYGETGLQQTIQAIHGAGMKQTGLPNQVTRLRANGVRIAVAAFAPYSNTADMLNRSAARQLIRKAASHAQVVVVYMHAGAEGTDAQHVTGHEEYFDGEDRGNAEAFAHMAVKAGADLVIASGPHVLRGMQFYRRRLIAYSLGNFANFHNFGTGGVLSDSAILHVTLSTRGRFRSGRVIPVHLSDDGQAMVGGGSLRVIRRLSHSDFPSSAARISGSGRIRRPVSRAG